MSAILLKEGLSDTWFRA